MNQMGFVEISLIKNDLLYRALLPMGVPWSDVHEALLELAVQVADHIEIAKQKQAESEAAEMLKEKETLEIKKHHKKGK